MATTTLRLPDGTSVTLEHDDQVTKEELLKYAEQELVTPAMSAKPIQKKEPSIGTDLKRVLLDTQRDVVSLIDYLPGDAFDTDEMSDLAKQRELSRLSGFGYLNTAEHIDPLTGKIKAPETAVGMAASIVPYIAGTGALVKIGAKAALKVAPKLASRSVPKIAQYTAAGAATSQVLTDLDENLFNVVADIFPEGTEGTVIDALQADANDTQTAKRLKLLIGDLGAGVVLEGLFRVAPAMKNIITAKSPTTDDIVEGLMGNAEALTKTSLRRSEAEAKNLVGPSRVRSDLPSEKETFKQSEKDLAQIEAQKTEGKSGTAWAKAKITQVGQQFFTSRGYAPSKMFAMFNQSQTQQRAIIVESTQVAQRLNNAFESFSDKAVRTMNKEKAQDLLTSDVSKYTSLPLEEQAVRMAADEGISKEVAEAVLDGRYLIDKLSRQIAGSKGFLKQTTESIEKNLGNYLRTSYKAFDDKANFVVDDVLKKDAINALTKIRISEALEEGIKRTDKQSRRLATKQINELLEATDDKTLNYLTQAKRVGKFHKKNENLPEEIKNLLQEIKDPAENIILSVSKAARIYEVNNFYHIANQLGKSGKYIQGPKSKAVEDEVLTFKITGTNSVLDGKYTTPEMGKFLNQQEETLKFLSGTDGAAEAYKVFLKYKGAAQASKTVYSHVTALRNILGGAQFAVANGNLSALNPLSRNRGHMKTLWNNMKGLGDKELDKVYTKYVELGVINTNIKVNQFKELMKISSQDFGTRSVTNVMKNNKILKGMEDFYMAGDDYFKMSGFVKELDTLKKARPNVSVDILEREAADIIQNTIPNYDRVAKGLKKLNYLPLGNFISFPAEIMRTSYHIVKQASKEINSGNTVLRNRGLGRLSGFTAAMVGVGQASKLSADLLGWSDEERQYHTKLAEGKFDKNSNFLWFRKENGDISKVSTKYLDSYNTIKEPVLAVLDRIIDGELKGEQLDDYLLKAAGNGMKTITTPFLSQSISTKAIMNVLTALNSPEGKTFEGKVLLPPSMSTGDKITTVVGQIVESVEPGTVTSLLKLNDYVDTYTGEEIEKLGPVNKQALIANMTGIKFTDHNPDTALKFAVSDYNKKMRYNIKPVFKVGEDSSISILENYIARQSKNYEYQQELFEKVNAYSAIYGRFSVLDKLKEIGMSRPAALEMMEGRFKPTAPPVIDDRVEKILKEAKDENANIYSEIFKTKREYNSVFNALSDLSLYDEASLNPFDLEEDTYERLSKATGGEVSEPVPNAPLEPDERINKLTGLPYNEGAGTAYMDQDDPMRRMNMAAGGRVRKSEGGEHVVHHGKDAVNQVVKREGELTPEQKYVVEHEGFVDGEYKDTKGISTSGVGQTGKYKDMSFKKVFKIHKDEAKRYVPKFDSLSENRQKALMSLIYRGDMKKDYKWVKHLNKGDYEKASVELLNHEEYKGLLKTNPKSGIIGRLEEASRFIKG